MRVPWAYVRLAQHWGLSCPQARHLWQALAHARGEVAVQWRERVLAADAPCRPGPVAPPHPFTRTPLQHAKELVHTACAPARRRGGARGLGARTAAGAGAGDGDLQGNLGASSEESPD